jgi:membrane protein insertase Oxa1/YidC/SpoIIIJ
MMQLPVVGTCAGLENTHGRPSTPPPACNPHQTTGFFWIPTLAGPTSLDNRGIEWLLPLVDGAPPIGWDAASRYLVLPLLLVACQYVSSAIISPPIDPNAENANTQRALYAFLPLMVGFFSLNVPAGEQRRGGVLAAG